MDKYNGININQYAKGGFRCVSPVPYDGVFEDAVKNFKFRNKRQYYFQLAEMMADSVNKEYFYDFDLVTYVPLHPKKLKFRGFNQSELLAKGVSENLEIPLVTTLRKTRNNLPQHKLKAPKREENVKGAYKIINKKLVEGKNILLVDDVVTTTNTLGECAKILDYNLAANVCCVTFAATVAKTT